MPVTEDSIERFVTIAHLVMVILSPVVAYFLWQIKNSLLTIAEHTVKIAILETRLKDLSRSFNDLQREFHRLSSDMIHIKNKVL